jgi:hypothetical protein
MKKYIFLLTISLLTTSIYGQLFKQDEAGIALFSVGSELIKQGYYKQADSILTLAMCSYKNENVYFNRAMARLMQTDTAGFCDDVEIAANKYFDKQSEGMYNSLCCKKVDTIYYDKKRTVSDKTNYRFYEVIKYPKNDSIIIGCFHDIKSKKQVINFDYGCENKMLGLNFLTTDIIAAYIIMNEIKYYYDSTNNPLIFNTTAYDNFKESAKIQLAAKYSKLKTENKKDSLTIYFMIYLDESGKVVKVMLEGFYPEISYDSDDYKSLEKDVLNLVKEYPKIVPAKFFNVKVRFMEYDFFEF